MYSRCIFCSHHLGRNEFLETFPVGEVIAFDAWKGRLWAVCPVCARWNLAPIEERWEAVESAEKRFRDSRLRVHSENVGIAQLPEGTRLVRVGDALPGEVAAWRYGRELRERRAIYWRDVVMMVSGELIAPGAFGLRLLARKRQVFHRVPAPASPTGEAVLIREKNLRGARIVMNPGDELQVWLPKVFSVRQRLSRMLGRREAPRGIAIVGSAANHLLSRSMVRVNAAGASGKHLRGALELVERFGSPAQLLFGVAGGALTLSESRLSMTRRLRGRGALSARRLEDSAMLALEMALHEETERRALEGELQALEEQWREAEEIAGIADLLPEDPLRRTSQRE